MQPQLKDVSYRQSSAIDPRDGEARIGASVLQGEITIATASRPHVRLAPPSRRLTEDPIHAGRTDRSGEQRASDLPDRRDRGRGDVAIGTDDGTLDHESEPQPEATTIWTIAILSVEGDSLISRRGLRPLIPLRTGRSPQTLVAFAIQ